jgi:hypothetical protein
MGLKYHHQLTASIVSLAIYSSGDVRSLRLSQRKCRFLEESELRISPVYSYNLCRMQCRVDQAMRLCGCIPHFYRTKSKSNIDLITPYHTTNRQKRRRLKTLKLNSQLSVPCQCRTSRSVRIREKYVTEPDMSKRVHYNIWQRYFLALTLTELSGHVTDKCE